MHSMLREIRVKSRVTRQASTFFFLSFFVVWLISHGIRVEHWPFHLAFVSILSLFLFKSWIFWEQSRLCNVCCNKFCSLAALALKDFTHLCRTKVSPGNHISAWTTCLLCRWFLCIVCQSGDIPPDVTVRKAAYGYMCWYPVNIVTDIIRSHVNFTL